MRVALLVALFLGALVGGCADDDFGQDLGGPAADFSGTSDMAVADVDQN